MRAWDLTFKQSLSLPTPPSRVALRSFAASFLVSRFFLSFLLRFSSVSSVFSPFPSSVLFPFFSFFLSELGGRGCEFARLSRCCPAACSLVCLPDSVIGVVFRDVVFVVDATADVAVVLVAAPVVVLFVVPVVAVRHGLGIACLFFFFLFPHSPPVPLPCCLCRPPPPRYLSPNLPRRLTCCLSLSLTSSFLFPIFKW